MYEVNFWIESSLDLDHPSHKNRGEEKHNLSHKDILQTGHFSVVVISSPAEYRMRMNNKNRTFAVKLFVSNVDLITFCLM